MEHSYFSMGLVTVKNGVNAPTKQMPGGAKNRKSTQKMEQTLQGAFFFLTEERPGYVANAPGRSFSRFFERKTPWGEPTTRRCSKRTCCRN